MTTTKKAQELIAHHMNLLLNVYQFDCEKFQAQMEIDRFSDFIENPNINCTTSEVNKEYTYLIRKGI